MLFVYLKSDFKQLAREPIMLLFAMLSLLLIGVFWLLLNLGAPILYDYTGFNLRIYEPYVLAMCYLLQPLMLGTVMGFFILDEKDAKITELLRVTPLGFSGYLMNRLMLPVVLTMVYVVTGWIVLGQSLHSAAYLPLIMLFCSAQTVMVGLYVAIISEDKVNGLTNAKAVSASILFGFATLFPQPTVTLIAMFTPQYYVTEAVLGMDTYIGLLGLLVHGLWVAVVIHFAKKRL